MANRGARSPARLRSRGGRLCYYRRLEYGFLVVLPCFLISSVSPSLSGYVPVIRVASSVLQSSAFCSFFFFIYFVILWRMGKIKLKLPQFHISDTCRASI